MRNLNPSGEARGIPQSEGHYRSYSLYSPLSMPLIFWPCLSVCFALYHIAVDQSKLCFFMSSLPAYLNFQLFNRRFYKDAYSVIKVSRVHTVSLRETHASV